MVGDSYLISLVMVVISQCIYISRHRVVYLKDIQFLLLNHMFIKLGKKKKKEKGFESQGTLVKIVGKLVHFLVLVFHLLNEKLNPSSAGLLSDNVN